MSSVPPAPAGDDPRPVVRLPGRGLPGIAIAAIGAVVALVLFLVLDGRRLQRDTARSPGTPEVAFGAPPPLRIPPEPSPEPASPIVITSTPVRAAPPSPLRPTPLPIMPVQPILPVQAPPAATPVRSTQVRTADPAIVFDRGATGAGPGGAQATSSAGGDDVPIPTTVIRNQTTIMPTGTIIPAVLETPIDSSRPGLVRGLIAEDARGFDGRRVLIPKGSRLIGEYAADIASGQKRVLVTWTRLIRPDGVAIRIGSPAADALGGAGVPGSVNTFFLQRFATAVLQSALAIGVNLASRPGDGSVIIGLPSNSAGILGQGLVPSTAPRPRIRVKQGAILNVFVARDLDFSGTPQIAEGARR